MIKKIIHSVAWSSIHRLTGVLAAFFINVLLARLMDKKELGLYFITFSLVMFLAILMRAGIKQTALKTVALARNHGEDLIAVIKKIMLITILTVSIIFVAMVTGVGERIALKVFKSSLMAENIGIIAFWGAMIAIAAPIGETLRALHFPGWGAAMDMALNNVMMLIIIATGYLAGYRIGYIDVVLAWAVVSALANILALIKLVHYLSGIEEKESLKKIIGYRNIFSGLVPILLLNLSTYITIDASLWVVGYALGHEHAAIYGAVLKLYSLLALPLLIINLGLEPHIADMFYSDRNKRLVLLIRLSATAGFYLTFAMSLVFTVWGESFLRFIYGSGFEVGAAALMVILVGNVVNVWTGSCATMLIVSGREKVLAATNMLGAILCIAMSIYMAPRYGIVGVSGSVAFSVAIVNLTLWWLVDRNLGVNTSAFISPFQVYEILKTLRHAKA